MKNKNVAAILALFLGGLGVHRFYLNQGGLGIFYAFTTMAGVTGPFSAPIGVMLGVIDAIVFFTMDQEKFDAKYNKGRANQRMQQDRRQQQPRTVVNPRPRQTDFNRNNRSEQNRYDQRRKAEEIRKPTPVKNNPYKISGVKKFKDYDYEGAIADFDKALEINAEDIAVHFNLACAHSLSEHVDKAFYHLDRAVAYGFKDFSKIKEHDALAFLRIQDKFDTFEKNGFRMVNVGNQSRRVEVTDEDNLLHTQPNLLEQLKKLEELRQKGLLTEAEYVAQKRRLRM